MPALLSFRSSLTSCPYWCCCRIRVLPPASRSPVARYREGGWRRSSRGRAGWTTPAKPLFGPRRVIELRARLIADGLDGGPVTIGWHLEREGLRAPATSTIRRILKQAGLITPEPRKRPRSSYTRFEMAQPNEMWELGLHPLAVSGLERGGDPELAR